MASLTDRPLDPRSASDGAALQALHEAAPGYSRLVHGRPPREDEALETLTGAPPGHAAADKTVLGFFLGDALVGAAEVLKGYPDPAVAYLGLLLFSEAHQGRGLGPLALARVYALAAEWGCASVRLAVVATNVRAHAFWRRQGFRECFRKAIPDVTGEAIVMERPRPGAAAGLEIRLDDLRGPEIRALLEAHLRSMRRISPPESVHALDLEALRGPGIAFWTVWSDAELLGCGALKELDARHGEIKSMRTAEAHRGKGVARSLLRHLLAAAEARGCVRVSLETGAQPAFEPARRLYAGFGFEPCPPFGSYGEDPNSVFMTRPLGGSAGSGRRP